ncbi:MAG: anaerobic ribonucleoside-triphosphate reductase activating protein [Nanoarchaeota archaeon]|nr:anaerobic ribonucleoside-triphosphate reductase activating protein [Nanoarchaeota archaeon]
MLDLAGIVDNSTIDYPGKISAVIYLCGCDFRCPFCHNREVVLNDPMVCKKAEVDEIVEEINNNFLIEGVVITGGEPLMQADTVELIIKLKGVKKLKLDTNASFPNVLEKVIGMLDFVAIDVKAPYDKYGLAIGTSNFSEIVKNVQRSMVILKSSDVSKEARTTIVPGINDSEEDMVQMCDIVKSGGFEMYSLQQFRPANTLDPSYGDMKSPSVEIMRKLGQTAKKLLPTIKVRISTIEHGFEDVL